MIFHLNVTNSKHYIYLLIKNNNNNVNTILCHYDIIK